MASRYADGETSGAEKGGTNYFILYQNVSLLAAPVIKRLYDEAAASGKGGMDSSAVSLMYKEKQKG